MIIYLDEAGDLGFDLSLLGTSRYFIMAGLMCTTRESIRTVTKAVKRTLKNKLPKSINEIKGGNTSLRTKQYFFHQLQVNDKWQIIAITADKEAWLKRHNSSMQHIDKDMFYDEIAKRLLSQIKIASNISHIQIVVDRSKTPSALRNFNFRISNAMYAFIPEKTLLSISHRPSFMEPGLQAIDLFCWGIHRKYQSFDSEWYDLFKQHILLEMELKL